MDMVQPGHGPEDEDDAARAFEALRGEVAALRRGIELVYRQAQQAPAAALDAPDYSPTLGAIAQELRAFGKRLDGMEAHPALKLTPAAYATQVTEGVRRVEGEAARSLTHAQGRFSDGLHELRSLIGSAHSQFVQQRREWIAVAIGAALGFVVWWPLAFLTPWGGGHWLAATLIGGGRWGAGQTLIEEANPVVWERMARLYRACPLDSTTELCEAALAVRTIPPSSEGPTAPSAVTPSRSGPRGARWIRPRSCARRRWRCGPSRRQRKGRRRRPDRCRVAGLVSEGRFRPRKVGIEGSLLRLLQCQVQMGNSGLA